MELSITLIIVVATSLLSISLFNRPDAMQKLMHWPYREVRSAEWYRLLTCGFVHSGWLHLLINMFVLYEFGRMVEIRFAELFGPSTGQILYITFYLTAIVAANIPTLVRNRDNSQYAGVGASGAVSGIVFIYIMFYPWQLLWLYAILPIPAIVAGIAYLWYSSWASKNRSDRIDHLAHFYGAVYGVVFMSAFKPQVLMEFLQKAVDIPYF